MKHTVPLIETSIRKLLPPPSAIAALMLVWFGITPAGHAVAPPPSGGYPGGNTAAGQNALLSLTTGAYNTGVGIFSLLTITDGNFCTGIGAGTLLTNTADQNTATGAGALFSNTTGEANTAHGVFALFNNTDGSNNVANGPEALFTNKTGQNNTATGAQTLFFNDGDSGNEEASDNSAFGNSALFGNTTGEANSAFGSDALISNDTGSFNTAVGDEALLNNIDGSSNTGVGITALGNNTSGFENTAVGHQALINCHTGSGNVGVGVAAGDNVTTASNVICIGNVGGENIDNSCYVANIYSNIQPVIGTDPDYLTISSNGRLGRSNLSGSSRRFKHDIQPIDKASEAILALKPVSFHYNKEYDATQRLSFGLIAEDVAEIAPDLVGRNKKGEPESVRYDQINAMLLNEFLKEHRKVQELEKATAALTAQVKEQAAQIQQVTSEVRMNKSTRKVTLNNL
jgi:hypothetical protein